MPKEPVPCCRVISSFGSLGSYGGGGEKMLISNVSFADFELFRGIQKTL